MTPAAKARLLEVLARDRSTPMRRTAASALGNLTGDDVQQALRRAAAEDPVTNVREAAAAALAAAERR